MAYQITKRAAVTGLIGLFLPTAGLAQATSASGDPLTVELSGIALPMVRGTVLVNYLFGVIVIQMGDAGSTFFLRENSFLLRDAIVRIASRAPIPSTEGADRFDRVAVTRVVLQAIQAIRPSARVVRVTVVNPAFMRN